MSQTMKKELKLIKARLKRIEDVIELSDTITSFEWKQFSQRDQDILMILYHSGREGASLTQIAKGIALSKPETSGKVIVSRRLRHIVKVSYRRKAFPLVVSDRRKWYLNYDDFQFTLKEEEK